MTQPAAHPEAFADLVLRGGVVLALDEADSSAEAVAVRGGRIARIGSDVDVAGLIGPDTEVIELAGRTLMPGINDSHLHATWLGARWPNLFFGGEHSDMHLSGMLAPDRASRRAAIERAMGIAASFGITSFTEPGIGPGENDGETGCFTEEVHDIYRELAAQGELTQRVTMLALYGILDGPSTLENVLAGISEVAARREDSDPEWFRVAGVKVFGDVIPLSKQAWTSHTYADGSHGGLLVEAPTLDEQEAGLKEMVRAGHRAGMQVAVHATGDLTIEAVLDAITEAAAEPGTAAANAFGHYLIHGDLATPEQIRRAASLGMWYNTQPGISAATGEWMTAVLGAEVAGAAWPLATALDAGILVLSSDSPISTPDWRLGIQAAEGWIAKSGAPTDPAAQRERLHRLLRAYTAVPAMQDGAAEWKGTLAEGMAADFVLLGANPYEAGAEGLPEVSIDRTIVAGRTVFARVGA